MSTKVCFYNGRLISIAWGNLEGRRCDVVMLSWQRKCFNKNEAYQRPPNIFLSPSHVADKLRLIEAFL